jgi:hypothetical protein
MGRDVVCMHSAGAAKQRWVRKGVGARMMRLRGNVQRKKTGDKKNQEIDRP